MTVVKRHLRKSKHKHSVVKAHKRHVKRKARMDYYAFRNLWDPNTRTWIPVKYHLGKSKPGDY